MGVRLLVASRNAKKLSELRRVLASEGIDGIEVVGLDEVPDFPEEPEDGATFAQNALIKARSGARATGLPCLADDSGLAVDALNGMPGVLSARWAGRHGDDAANNALLLAQLADVPDERRGAAFVSACALVTPGADGGDDPVGSSADAGPSAAAGANVNVEAGAEAGAVEAVEEGRWPGSVLRAEHGERGFGYDPLFLPEGSDRAAAELTAEEKDAASHRGRALRRLAPALRALARGDHAPCA